MLCGLHFPWHFFPWCFAGHTFRGAFHNVFCNAFHYVKLRYVRDDSVLHCIMLCVTLCGWRNVADGMWVTTWVTRGWCDGDDVWITLRGKHYMAVAVQMALRGWWCVSIHTGVKTQFRISKWIAHVSVLYNIDVTCQRGNDTTCCIILHAVLRHFPHTMK